MTRVHIMLPTQGDPNLVGQGLACGELADAVDRRFADRGDRFAGKESLMARHNDIGKGKEALEDIVGNDGARQIAIKEIGLLLINIKPQAAQLPAFQCVDGRLRIDEPATARIDEQGAPLQTCQGLPVDDVFCLRRQGTMQ